MTSRDRRAAFLAALEQEGLVLPVSASGILDAYAGQVARMEDARSRVDAEGEIVPGPRDQPIAHPALAVERAATAEVAKLYTSLRSYARAPRAGIPRLEVGSDR